MDPNANVQEQESILHRASVIRRIKAGTLTATQYERGVWDSEEEGLIDARGDSARLRELRRALRDWLADGGFEPDWHTCPNTARTYRKA